jgi:hypothetical protein
MNLFLIIFLQLLIMEYKVGDVVLIKTLEQIKKEFVCKENSLGSINVLGKKEFVITHGMLSFLGREIKIIALVPNLYVYDFYSENYHWPFDFIEDNDYQVILNKIREEIYGV